MATMDANNLSLKKSCMFKNSTVKVSALATTIFTLIIVC